MESSFAGWTTDVFYENATYVRRDVGLTKFRNTLQSESDKKLGTTGPFSNFSIRAIFRGTYDGVYDMNASNFGNRAGGAVLLGNSVPGGGPALPPVPEGGGVPLFNSGDVPINNPNKGLILLGSRLHQPDNGFDIGVPVRPCNVDSRGCIKSFLDYSENELEFPEFNRRLDFLRELYFTGSIPLANGSELFLKVGRQQVVWGRTDLFRVLDVINPVDYSRNNIYDELQDIRIPMWIAQAEYRMGATGPLSDLNFQVVWNFDKFRPNNVGQGGTPNSILDAGSFFRGLKNLWDNGGTVANFAGAGIGGPNPGLAALFGPHQIGIREADLPQWSLGNTQLGAKLEGAYQDVGFSLNALTFRSQLPSLRGGITSVNPFTGAEGVFPYLPAFDIVFPRVTLFGGSMDVQADAIKSVFRLEGAFTRGEEFPNTARERLFSESRVFRYVIGWDRPTFIPFLNPDRSFLISAQLFGQYLLDHETHNGPYGPVGMPDWKFNQIGTLLIKGNYMNDRLSPQLLIARDFRAHSTVWGPSIDWLATDKLRFTLAGNIKSGSGAQVFDNDMSANPYGSPPGPPGATPTPSLGFGSFEPLGRFRAGPIGMAREENEVQLTVRYKF
jgi:hypothetical protein